MVEATPPDRRAKEIEQKLITFEETAKRKQAAAKKKRDEAERLVKLADQDDEEAHLKLSEIGSLKQQLKDIRGELGAHLHLKGQAVISVSTKALIESFPDEPGANEIRFNMEELEASMVNYANGVADHAGKVLRGEVRTGTAIGDVEGVVLDVPDDSDLDSDTDDELFSFVKVPTGTVITPEMWAACAKKQEAHHVQCKEKEATRRTKRDTRRKKDGEEI